MAGSGLATASIVDIDHGVTVQCMFNPNDYSFSKSNNWTAGNGKGFNLAQYEFGSGGPTILHMQLFFDTYSNVKSQGTVAPKDVRKAYTTAIWTMVKVDPALALLPNSQGRPPIVSFQWGTTWAFKSVITDISERFTLFMPNGMPVRSTLDVTFQQVEDENELPGTNPTSGGVGGERVWTVKAGDTLSWIAYTMYGDSTLWRLIASANKLTHIRSLTPGLQLEIPNA
jgi:hypothetical protein